MKKIIEQNKDMPANFRVGQEELKRQVDACEYSPPIILHKVWHIYWELRARTDRTQPISFQEIESYLKLLGDELQQWEIKLISLIDNDFVRIVNSKEQ